jgi:hypothetical protein
VRPAKSFETLQSASGQQDLRYTSSIIRLDLGGYPRKLGQEPPRVWGVQLRGSHIYGRHKREKVQRGPVRQPTPLGGISFFPGRPKARSVRRAVAKARITSHFGARHSTITGHFNPEKARRRFVKKKQPNPSLGRVGLNSTEGVDVWINAVSRTVECGYPRSWSSR